MSDSFVTVASFPDYIAANIAKTKLESEGIRCFVINDIIVTLNWLYSNLFGGVQVEVAQSDVAKALSILNADPIQLEEIDKETIADSELACPECACSNVYEKKHQLHFFFSIWFIKYPLGFLAVIGALLAGGLTPAAFGLLLFARLFLVKNYRCADCGCAWNQE